MWVLWKRKMRSRNCEFCQKWTFENVNFVKNEISKCEFSRKNCGFLPQCGTKTESKLCSHCTKTCDRNSCLVTFIQSLKRTYFYLPSIVTKIRHMWIQTFCNFCESNKNSLPILHMKLEKAKLWKNLEVKIALLLMYFLKYWIGRKIAHVEFL